MPQKVPALFIADSLGLDFLNSVATPVDTRIDWLIDGEGFLSWLEQAQLVPREVLDRMRQEAKPSELDLVAAEARKLREWFRTCVRARNGRSAKSADLSDLEPLNRLLERDEVFGRLVAQKRGKTTIVEFQSMRRWRSPESLLQPIAEELAKLLAHEDLSHIKACEGASCTLLFADRTRGKSRRWCSMGICGNRAKQTALRRRRHKQP